ncbi:MAG: hypothetical protein KAU95_03000 [Candidatus Aenigmarchaeota archaeon]|nr:hypothetical protein [Candidatus Aenigmarchaeota archaeon]
MEEHKQPWLEYGGGTTIMEYGRKSCEIPGGLVGEYEMYPFAVLECGRKNTESYDKAPICP